MNAIVTLHKSGSEKEWFKIVLDWWSSLPWTKCKRGCGRRIDSSTHTNTQKYRHTMKTWLHLEEFGCKFFPMEFDDSGYFINKFQLYPDPFESRQVANYLSFLHTHMFMYIMVQSRGLGYTWKMLHRILKKSRQILKNI